MGYMNIPNLYRPEGQYILMFRECFALEKIHGTSANVAWRDGRVHLSPGGETAARFSALFDVEDLAQKFAALGHGNNPVVVYGEAYGGKQQAMARVYGPNLRFAAFDVMVGETWLSVPNAAGLVAKMGLAFVPYTRTTTDLAALDALRDAPSEQAKINGVEGDQPREGVVLRPVLEAVLNGQRVIAKHKTDAQRETKTPRKVVDPSELAVLTEASAIAEEWVTQTRLSHVLGKFADGGVGLGMGATRAVIGAMLADVEREGTGEFVPSEAATRAIAKRTAALFGEWVRGNLKGGV